MTDQELRNKHARLVKERERLMLGVKAVDVQLRQIKAELDQSRRAKRDKHRGTDALMFAAGA